MSSESVLKVEKLKVSYGSKVVVRDVSFSLSKGTITSLIGPNGAGKSSLLKSIAGLYPCRGQIEILGQPLESYSRKKLASVLAYIPQRYFLNTPFSVAQFLLMSRYPFHSAFSRFTKLDRSAVNSILEVTSLSELESRYVTTLSGGEQQRLLIAAALVQGARILVLDEPVGALDPYHRQEVFSLLLKLKREQQLTVLIVQHDLNSAVIMSDKIIALRSGDVLHDGPASSIMEADTLRRIYNTDFVFVPHPIVGTQMIVPREL